MEGGGDCSNVKKGEGKVVEECQKGIVDGGVIQGIYDGVSGKIKEEVRGRKGDSAESDRGGFRKGMGTIDNICVKLFNK